MDICFVLLDLANQDRLDLHATVLAFTVLFGGGRASLVDVVLTYLNDQKYLC